MIDVRQTDEEFEEEPLMGRSVGGLCQMAMYTATLGNGGGSTLLGGPCNLMLPALCASAIRTDRVRRQCVSLRAYTMPHMSWITRTWMGGADVVEDHAKETQQPSVANQILLQRQQGAKKRWAKVGPRGCRLCCGLALPQDSRVCLLNLVPLFLRCSFREWRCRKCLHSVPLLSQVPALNTAHVTSASTHVSAWPLWALSDLVKLAAEGGVQGDESHVES